MILRKLPTESFIHVMRTIRICKDIYPDFDAFNPDDLEHFLMKSDLKVDYLLDDGIQVSYPEEKMEAYQVGSDSIFLRDTMTKAVIFHIYEGFGSIVFENHQTGKTFELTIQEDIL